MKSTRPDRPTYKMPLDELLELLGATRKTTGRRKKPERRVPRPGGGDDQDRGDAGRRSGSVR